MTKAKYKRPQTPEEEKVNALTHGVGFLAILVALPFLGAAARSGAVGNSLFGISVFGAGMLSCYLSSTVYHLIVNEKLKHRARIFDHVSIFLLIGGTYTPIVYKYIQEPHASNFLMLMWGIIFAGAIFKIFLTGRFNWLSTVLYLFLGWMAIFIAKPLSEAMPLHVFWWILAGGLSYTIGVVFYKWNSLKYAHAIWHCFVMAGTGFHFVAVYKSMFV